MIFGFFQVKETYNSYINIVEFTPLVKTQDC